MIAHTWSAGPLATSSLPLRCLSAPPLLLPAQYIFVLCRSLGRTRPNSVLLQMVGEKR